MYAGLAFTADVWSKDKCKPEDRQTTNKIPPVPVLKF